MRFDVLGGVAAQMSQALGSLLLQVVAARLLGAEGLGAFAVLYGLVIMATAVCTGFVGDSLTVLDRSRRDIRSALQSSLFGIAVLGAAVAFLVGWLGGFLSPGASLVFAAATAAFLVEDVLRRLLMAGLRFWRIVIVDLAGLAGSVATLLAVALLAGDQIGLGAIVLALLAGQVVAAAVAVAMLPTAERWLAPLRVGAIRTVSGYGSWRAAQQFIRPGMLTAVRLLVVAMAGLAATGALEAARIYTAPLLLVVSGASSFLFASYASAKPEQSSGLLRRADRGVLGLFGATIAMAVMAVLAMGLLGPLLTSGNINLSVVAVIGWCVYAVSVATVTPYGALAAVQRRQAAVLMVRTADSVLSLIAVAVVLSLGGEVDWVPLVLAAGSLAGGIAIRQLLLVNQVEPAHRP
jgi:O-antigen/teichoic acid export membrane protein